MLNAFFSAFLRVYLRSRRVLKNSFQRYSKRVRHLGDFDCFLLWVGIVAVVETSRLVFVCQWSIKAAVVRSWIRRKVEGNKLYRATSQIICLLRVSTSRKSHEAFVLWIFDKITPLWKRIGTPPENQTGCCRGDPGQQRHSASSYDLFWLNKTVRRLRHWNFHFLSFWLALSLLCDVSYVTINEKLSW